MEPRLPLEVSPPTSHSSPSQVNVQVPSNVGTGPQPLIVTTQSGGPSNSYSVAVNSEQPGLLAPLSFKLGGNQYVVALFPDNTTYVLPSGAVAGITSRPAQPGDTIILYGVGFGAVIPAIPAGQLAGPLNTLAAPFPRLLRKCRGVLIVLRFVPRLCGLISVQCRRP